MRDGRPGRHRYESWRSLTAAYNIGAIGIKNTIVGQAYGRNWAPRMLRIHSATESEMREKCILPWLLPCRVQSWPAERFRIFKKAERVPLQLGLPSLDESRANQSDVYPTRLCTSAAHDPTLLGATDARHIDAYFLGSNDLRGITVERVRACHGSTQRSFPEQLEWYRVCHQGLICSMILRSAKTARASTSTSSLAACSAM